MLSSAPLRSPPTPAAPANRPLSRRDKRLALLWARRAEFAKRRENKLDDLTSGGAYAFLSARRKLSVPTARRDVGRALDLRHLERPDRYVRLQGERFTNALKATNHALLNGPSPSPSIRC